MAVNRKSKTFKQDEKYFCFFILLYLEKYFVCEFSLNYLNDHL